MTIMAQLGPGGDIGSSVAFSKRDESSLQLSLTPWFDGQETRREPAKYNRIWSEVSRVAHTNVVFGWAKHRLFLVLRGFLAADTSFYRTPILGHHGCQPHWES